MQYEGVITHIGDVEEIGENKTAKKTIVLEENTDREYKGGLAFDLWGEKVSLIDGYNVGDVITVHLNTRAREYNGRWYNSISWWKIEGNASSESAAPAPAKEEWDDDLPF